MDNSKTEKLKEEYKKKYITVYRRALLTLISSALCFCMFTAMFVIKVFDTKLKVLNM